ncbi:glycosyltransferase family 4 protein [Shewanella sp. 6_MG-2023]|uniref:glycosyltransferase n=1 Tax=Shewanella sp. 6_MG-2023 TaxID=3062660 RepID=UPI0026E27E7B|nr:glycosyltransferase family 4 protein [Shewanella sp. 6_MG-2023]MDO6617627.1 glycosyltransferase family 4 protein [Shewanella sp. 6_MG-2023]
MTDISTISQVKGFIDTLDAGRIRGWVFDPKNEGERARFYVALDGMVITQGIADLYRQDLEQAGFGTGHCSFSIPFTLPFEAVAGKKLTLLDKDGRLIDGARLEVATQTPNVTMSLEALTSHQLAFIYNGEVDLNTSVILSVDGVPTSSQDVILQSQGVDKRFLIPLPSTVERGKETSFQLAVVGSPCVVWQETLFVAALSGDSHFLVPELEIPKLTPKPLQASKNEAAFGTSREKMLFSAYAASIKQVRADNSQILSNALAISLGSKEHDLVLPNVDAPEVTIVLPLFLAEERLSSMVSSVVLATEPMTYQIIWITNTHQHCDIANLVVVQAQAGMNEAAALHQALVSVAAKATIVLPSEVDISCSCIAQIKQALHKPYVGFVSTKLVDFNGQLIDREVRGRFDGALKHALEHKAAQSANHCQNSYFRAVNYALFSVTGYKTALIKALPKPDSATSATDMFVYWQKIINQEQLGGYCLAHAYALSQVSRQEWLPIVSKQYQVLENQQGENSNQPTLSVTGQPILGTVVMIDAQTPTPDHDAGSYAAVEEIKLIQSLGYHVVFIPLAFTYRQAYTARLQELGVEVCYAPYYSSIGDLLCEKLKQADAVYITRYYVASQYIDFIKVHAPSLPILFNNADLHFLREIRSALAVPLSSDASKQKREELLQQAQLTKVNELSVMDEVDVILSYNEHEHAVITSHLLEQNKIFTCPWVLHPKSTHCQFEASNGIAFLGGYKHQPNVEAVEYFFENIFPKLMESDPSIIVSIYGSNMPESFKRYEHPNVELVGFVENLDDVFLRHRIFIAPLLSGAGIKGKVLESTSYGIPSVLSPIAAESTGLVHQVNSLIANTPEEWVQQIKMLYNDHILWNKLSAHAISLANERYSSDNALLKMSHAFRYAGLKTTVT